MKQNDIIGFITVMGFMSLCIITYINAEKTKIIKQEIVKIEKSEIPIQNAPDSSVIPYTNLIRAIIDYESKGIDNAENLKSNAVGCMQIRPIMVKEVNRILRIIKDDREYSLYDRYDRRRSIQMFNIWKQFHHENDSNETIARCWHGGPDGDKGDKNMGYWYQIKKRL